MNKYFNKKVAFPIVFLSIAFLIFLFTSKAQAATLSKAPNNLGLVGYWALNEGTSTTATDSSGFGNHGTLTNTESTDWILGKRGKALEFDGTNDFIDVGTSESLQPTTGLTVSTWVRRTGNFSDVNGIVTSVKNNNFDGGYILTGTSANKVRMYIWTGGGWALSESTTVLTLGQWYHVSATWDGSNIKLYINGVQEDTDAAGSLVYPGTDWPTSIGRYGGVVHTPATLDEVRIYNRALSATEIVGLGQGNGQAVNQKVVSRNGLVAHWTFDDATSTKATDFSGNNNVGTLTNMDPTTDWVAGKRGKALDFDGINDYVTAGGQSSLGVSDQAYSISAWAKISSNENNGNIIVVSATDGGGGWCVPMLVVDNGFFKAISYNGSFFTVQPSTAAEKQLWYHLTTTWDATNGLRLFVNGILASSTAQGTYSASGGTNIIQLGLDTNCGGDTGYFEGQIDDVRVYNRALSVTEVNSLYRENATKINSSQNTKQTNGLVGLWSFNGADVSGTTAYDRSGQGNTGTITNGATPSIGKVGQALNLDGTNDYVDLGTSASLQPASALTVSAWVKRTGSFVDINGIITSVKDNSHDGGYILSGTAANKIRMYIWNGSGWVFSESTTVLPIGQWYQLTGVWDGTNVKLYINGVQEDSDAVSSISYTGTSYATFIGTYGQTVYTPAVIDEVRIYNRGLSASEVKQLYLTGK